MYPTRALCYNCAMRRSVQETEEWCKERGVTLAFEKRQGEEYVFLSKGNKSVSAAYKSGPDGNRETVLGQAVFDMERWLDNDITSPNGAWVSNS